MSQKHQAALETLLERLVKEGLSDAGKRIFNEEERSTQDYFSQKLTSIKDSVVTKTEDLEEDEADDLEAILSKLDGDKGESKEKDAAPEKKAAPEPEATEEPEEAPDTGGADKTQTPKISFVMIRDKLNTIRSGRSLKDDDIRTELKQYVNSLSKEEKLALYAFLDGIAQIITTGLDSEEADEPSKSPFKVKMDSPDSDDEVETREIKPRRQQATQRPVRRVAKKSRPAGIEDTAPPITVEK